MVEAEKKEHDVDYADPEDKAQGATKVSKNSSFDSKYSSDRMIFLLLLPTQEKTVRSAFSR